MTNLCRCPSCAQPIDVTSYALHAVVNCPTCGTRFAVPASGGQADVAAPSDWTPRGASRAGIARKRSQPAPAVIMAILASAGLLLVVVVAVAASRGGGANSDQRESSSTKPVARKPAAKSALRPEAAPSSARAPHRQAASSAKPLNKSVDQDRSGLEPESEPAAGDSAPSGAAPASETGEKPADPAVGAASSALANAIMSAQRPATGDQVPAKSESPGTGSPKDYQVTEVKEVPDVDDAKDLSLAERRRLAEIAKLKKLIQRHFIAQRRTSDRSRGQAEDFFVVAKYEMPLDTRVADVRFEVTEAIEPSVNQVADYLLATSAGVMRDFQVVARFDSMSGADEGIVAVRQRYDQAKEYQAQLLAFLQAQQRFQASSIRRC